MIKFELIEDFQNTPVNYVGVHPIRWKELGIGDPDVGFREILTDTEIRLDGETIIRLGHDKYDINDGVAPDTVLGSGVIKDEGKYGNYNPICYTIIHRKEK